MGRPWSLPVAHTRRICRRRRLWRNVCRARKRGKQQRVRRWHQKRRNFRLDAKTAVSIATSCSKRRLMTISGSVPYDRNQIQGDFKAKERKLQGHLRFKIEYCKLHSGNGQRKVQHLSSVTVTNAGRSFSACDFFCRTLSHGIGFCQECQVSCQLDTPGKIQYQC